MCTFEDGVNEENINKEEPVTREVYTARGKKHTSSNFK